MSHPDELAVAIAAVELVRAIGDAAPLRRFVERPVMPGSLTGKAAGNLV